RRSGDELSGSGGIPPDLQDIRHHVDIGAGVNSSIGRHVVGRVLEELLNRTAAPLLEKERASERGRGKLVVAASQRRAVTGVAALGVDGLAAIGLGGRVDRRRGRLTLK